MKWLPRKTAANSQLTMNGFHMMKVRSCNKMVSPPNTTSKPSVTRCMVLGGLSVCLLCCGNRYIVHYTPVAPP